MSRRERPSKQKNPGGRGDEQSRRVGRERNRVTPTHIYIWTYVIRREGTPQNWMVVGLSKCNAA